LVRDRVMRVRIRISIHEQLDVYVSISHRRWTTTTYPKLSTCQVSTCQVTRRRAKIVFMDVIRSLAQLLYYNLICAFLYMFFVIKVFGIEESMQDRFREYDLTFGSFLLTAENRRKFL
jgi:hypothetical protein